MLIDVGWTADGAAWSDARGGGLHGRVRMGPRALVQLLQTRLGLTRPEVDRAVRTAQYMRLIQQLLTVPGAADAFWPARSFAVDPWSTTGQLLRWRDAAVEAGWRAASAPADLPARLAALRDVEALVVVGMPGTTGADGRPATLGPSVADDLVELLDRLEDTAGAWPLGIEEITAQEDPATLPGLWPRLLAALERSGVAVNVPPREETTDGDGPRLEVIRCQDEWSAADVAARYLAAPPAAGERSLTLLAGADTTVLDQALRRRGLPAAGAVGASTDRAHHQVLGLFLDVATAPVDVHQLAALLDLRVLPGTAADAEPIGLVPAAARRRLLRALTQQPGVGGPAWQRALQDLAEDQRPGAGRALEAARAIDRLVTDPLPPSDLRPAAISARLDRLVPWLGAASPTPVRTVQAVLAMLEPGVVISRRTLQQIIDACGGSGRSPLAGAEVAEWTLTARPAHVRADGGTVLWWGPAGSQAPQPVLWDRAEQEALRAGGAHLIGPEQMASLHVDAALRGLRSAAVVIAVLPGQRLEKTPAPSGLLAHLEAACGRGEKDRRPPESLLAPGSWSLAGRRLPVHVPELRASEPAPAAHRELAGGEHLLPDRLSFTAAQTLVGCPHRWLLQHALDVRPAALATLPTGDRMIGSLVHAVVEALVRGGGDEDLGGAPLRPPTDDEITAALDALLPRLASELDLPGHAAQRADVHERTVRSLRELFTRTDRAGLRITGAESRFTRPLTLPLERGDRTVDFVGSRDLDLRDDRGRPTVIDLKWSRSRSRYGDLHDTGDAVQLASYAWSLESEDPRSEPAEVGYFLLHSGEFIAAQPELDPGRRTPMDVRDSFGRLVSAVVGALDEIVGGRATTGCRARLEHAGLPLDARYDQRRTAMASARADARAQGSVAMESYCATSEYAQLCGMTGELR